MWGVDVCRPKQIVACKRIVYDPSSLGKLIVIDRTGVGKSHILRMVATMVNGITIVIIPLLALTADQMANLIKAIQLHGSVEAHHLDDTSPSAIANTIIPRMDEIGHHTSSSMFLLSSPQQIVENPALLAALLCCHAKQTLRLVAIDEVHLYAMHGRSFRVAMRILQRLFFEVVFKSGVWHPLFLGMTATMTDSLITLFATLTNVKWNTKNEKDPYNKYPHLLWSDASEFRQRYINMV